MKIINLLNLKSSIFEYDNKKSFITHIFPNSNTYCIIYVKESYAKRSYYHVNKVMPIMTKDN